MKSIAILICLTAVVITAAAQVSAPPPNRAQSGGVSTPQTAAINDLSPLLGQLQQTAQAINLDVARLRVEKWKADSNTKQQAQQNVESISRNISGAMPGMVDQVRANPQSLASAFKLYRNINALYDVFAGLTESAGAFGPKNEYEMLARDAGNLDNLRRAFGDKMQTLASLTDSEISRLRTQLQAAVTAPPAPPKKIVVDDEEKPKKPVKKKAKPAAAAAAKPTTPAKQ